MQVQSTRRFVCSTQNHRSSLWLAIRGDGG
jgi:hypothetical protein